MSTDATKQLLTSHRLDRGARPRRAEAKELNIIFDHRCTFLSKEGEYQVYNLEVFKATVSRLVDASQVKLEECRCKPYIAPDIDGRYRSRSRGVISQQLISAQKK